MMNFIMKLIICPLAVIIGANMLPNVNFDSIYQPIMIGIILAISGILLEYLFLKRGTLWISTGADFIASFLIVYIVSLALGADVTFNGALLVGLLLMFIEYFVHHWLIRTGRTRKSPA